LGEPDSSRPSGLQVKLRYASLINYALNLTGAVFTLFFLTLLARRLAVEDYANWIMITRYLSYIIIPGIIYTYWVTRDISRGNNDSKTAINLSVGMGVVFMPIYVLLMLIFSANFEQPLVPLLVSTLIVFFDFLYAALHAISNGHAPQLTGYGTFSLKIVQAASGLFLVGFAAMGLTGAVIAALLGRIAADAALLVMNRHILRQSRFEAKIIKQWLKSSWLPLFMTLASMIYTFDVLVVRIFYQSEIPIAYYGIALNLLSAVMFANVVSSTLYPKILSKKSLEDLDEAIWLILLLSVPVAMLMIFYARPLIAIFGVQYVPATIILQLLIIYSIIQIFSNLANTVYVGLERIDENGLSSPKGLAKSALFKSSLIILGANVAYLVILSTISTLRLDITNITVGWASLLIITSTITFLSYLSMLKRDFSKRFPYKITITYLAKFLVAAIPAALPLFLFNIEISEGFYQMILNMAFPVFLSATLYFVMLYLIDRKFRSTLGEVLRKLGVRL
jgi:O-antigen/teichoic acid export membrane protein